MMAQESGTVSWLYTMVGSRSIEFLNNFNIMVCGEMML
jgi:hypothetical protein